jgi:pilus assembly protein Flp/PilA
MLKNYVTYLKAFLGSKKGQGMVEYGLIIALIAVAVIVALTTMGTKISDLFDGVSGKLNPPS